MAGSDGRRCFCQQCRHTAEGTRRCSPPRRRYAVVRSGPAFTPWRARPHLPIINARSEEDDQIAVAASVVLARINKQIDQVSDEYIDEVRRELNAIGPRLDARRQAAFAASVILGRLDLLDQADTSFGLGYVGRHRQLVTSGQLNCVTDNELKIYCQHTLQISAQILNFWVLEALCSAAVT